MALIKTTLVSEVSGRLGGIIFSHNAGGAYIRQASIPTNPNSPEQAVVRAAVAQLSAEWSGSMDQPQRESWELYASNVKLTNRVGDQVNVSGLAMYVRSNVARIQAGLATVVSAPAVFDLGNYSKPFLDNATTAAQTLDVNHGVGTFSDPWANVAGGFMFSYFSRPQNPGIKFFKGPYRFAGVIIGDPAPPASPATIASPFVFVPGQRIFGRHFTVLSDGRLSAATFTTTLTVP